MYFCLLIFYFPPSRSALCSSAQDFNDADTRKKEFANKYDCLGSRYALQHIADTPVTGHHLLPIRSLDLKIFRSLDL